MSVPTIVAEISANHNGDFATAKELVEAAAWAGADAVKFQTWSRDRMALGADVIRTGPWAGQSLKELYDKAWLPWDWHVKLYELARNLGLVPFSSVFDTFALQFLESLHCPMYKIASCELVDLPLLRAVSQTGKPMILSTGMATRGEIDDAVHTVRSAKNTMLTLLKCTSAYPAHPDKANLATMAHMAREYKCETGLSDHTTGIGVPILAAGCGARMIEKHIRLAVTDSLDKGFSLSPAAFKEMVDGCRQAVNAWGDVKYGPDESEASVLTLRRSLHWAVDLKKGAKIERAHVVTARPATGLAPRYLSQLVEAGQLTKDVRANTPVKHEDYEIVL